MRPVPDCTERVSERPGHSKERCPTEEAETRNMGRKWDLFISTATLGLFVDHGAFSGFSRLQRLGYQTGVLYGSADLATDCAISRDA